MPDQATSAAPRIASAVATGALLVGAVVVALVGPATWFGPVGVMAIAAVLIWWTVIRGDRAHARDLAMIDARLARLVGREPDPAPTLARVLERAGEVEAQAGEEARTRGEAVERATVAVELADVPIIAADARGRVFLANAAVTRALGLARASLAGRELEDALLGTPFAALASQARAGAAARGRVRVAREDGTRYFDAAALPIGGGSGDGSFGVVLTLRDVTELATAVQLKSDFASNASHELRTPIAAIKGAVETLEAAEDDPAMTARLRTMIVQHVGRLEELVNDLLDLSRLESPDAPTRPTEVAMSSVAGALDQLFADACSRRRLRLVFDLDPALETMVIDARLLELVLRNLIDNATRFAREGTEIRVIGRATQVEPAADADRVFADPSLIGARFRVVDKGIGIPLAHQQRIFERFYQVDPSRDGSAERRGTGLGLAIVKHALRRLGGRISVESVWQQGTTMTFEVPSCVDVAPGTGPAPQGPASAPARKVLPP